jgi:hypothetical protein
MGGHSAWRKRVAAGGLAKQGSAGAIARHRPHFGRKGEDLKLNRKGNIAGGNPKTKKFKQNQQKREAETLSQPSLVTIGSTTDRLIQILMIAAGFVVISSILAILHAFFSRKR